MSQIEVDPVATAIPDEAAFDAIVRPLLPQLHAHCYRMLASTHDADDAIQEALVRAWRGWKGFQGRGSVRSWLYTVATRTCLDLIAGRGRRALPMDLGPASDHVRSQDAPITDVDWLEPYPTAGMISGALGPAAAVEQREAVELAFIAALQHVPANQRAALVLFEVLGYSVAEIADTMQTSVAAVNSALQRARQIVAGRVPAATQLHTLRMLGDDRTSALVQQFSQALERGEVETLIALLSQDVSWSMPPLAGWYSGIASVSAFAAEVPLGSCGVWRSRVVNSNGQPAVALYLRATDGEPFTAWSINVLTVAPDGRIEQITSFLGVEHFASFDLPAQLLDEL